MEQQSHAALVKETVEKLEAYDKGTPAALEKFMKVRERIRKEEEEAAKAGGGAKVNTSNVGAGSPSGQAASNAPTAPMATPMAAPGYDASRDPRRRW